MNNDATPETGQWVILQVMGHVTLAGLARKSEEWGPLMVRIDVPPTSRFDAFTKFIAPPALYDITPVGEAVARRMAERLKVDPVTVYDPEIVTRQAHEEVVDNMRRQMNRLRNALPPGAARGEDDDAGDYESDDLEAES